MDNKTVPLLDEKRNVIGDVVLENRKEGTHATCTLNKSEPAEHIKKNIEVGRYSRCSVGVKKEK